MTGTPVRHSVLVVDQHPRALARLVEPLREAGYDVAGATTFEAAKRRLSERPPNLLIAASRLGLFNGLHLALRASIDHPEMAIILTAPDKDPLLEAEACSYGACCVVSPRTPTELLALVARTFASRLASALENFDPPPVARPVIPR